MDIGSKSVGRAVEVGTSNRKKRCAGASSRGASMESVLIATAMVVVFGCAVAAGLIDE